MFSHIKEFFTRPSGYTIARSVRLRSSASAYFNRTPSASSRTTWTWTAWVKRGKLGSAQALFSAGTGTAEFRLTFTSSDTIEIYEYTSPSYNWQKITTAVYRDPSAWYQIQLVYDTTNGTAGDRVKLYVNSVQVTSFGTNTNPTPSFSGYVNSAVAHGIGSFSTGSSYLDGYLTEINFIDGQALTPSSFGETDSITGVWKAKKYGGTYGTNGFYLNFSDNSSNTATTIGKDYSGNGNNWTPNNISVTAGATYDSMVDVPTLYADGGNGRGNYAVLNPLYTNGFNPLTITNGNLTATSSSGARLILSTLYQNTGAYYFEATCTTVGTLTGSRIGIRNDTVQRFYDNSGNYFDGSSSAAYGATYTTGDVLGVAFDLTNQTITFYKNGTSQGQKTAIGLTGQDVTPFVYADTSGVWNVNFGQRPFSYTPPTGFVALNTYNLPASTIKNGAGYMAATLYTGNGSTQSISNAVNGTSFQPDLVWVKGRSVAYSHGLYDSVRGVNKRLISNLTNAEDTLSGVSAFSSGGFSLGSDINFNQGSATYVGWQWKANGSAVTNTAGSITSQVNAGATQGFSVVTYTANNTAGATIGHGLGVAPSFIIVKCRNNANSWNCYHNSLGNTQGIDLNSTGAASSSSLYWNNTSPTSTVFSVSTYTNNSTFNYVAYCFAAVAGFSAFGSYTGNGSSDGPFVFTGFRPRFVMFKRTDAIASWRIIDTARESINATQNEIYPNLSNAEAGAPNGMDILSNGFKLRGSYSEWNASGGTFMYACFAENPFKNSLAR